MKFNLFNCKAFRKKKHVAQGGAILDQVISESCSPNNKILLYKLANYKLGSSRLRNPFFDEALDDEHFSVLDSSLTLIARFGFEPPLSFSVGC
jgi:hypothetical protein